MKHEMPSAIILAAGEGTRLRPFTLDRPKCLVEVDGVSLLDRHIAVLKAAGIDEITVIGGYRADMLERRGFDLVVNPRYAETNMVSTLFCADDKLTGDVLICYGDIVYSPKILAAVLASDKDIAVAIDLDWESYWRARNDDILSDAETLRLGPDNTILEIGQKPTAVSEIEGQFMGLIKMSRQGVSAFRRVYAACLDAGHIGGKPVEKAYMTDLLQEIIHQKVDVHAALVQDRWVEVDTVDDLNSRVTRDRLSEIERQLAANA